MAKTSTTKTRQTAKPYSRGAKGGLGGSSGVRKSTLKTAKPAKKGQKHKDAAMLEALNSDEVALHNVYSVKSKETLAKQKSEALKKLKDEEREKRLATKKELEKQMDELAEMGL